VRSRLWYWSNRGEYQLRRLEVIDGLRPVIGGVEDWEVDDPRSQKRKRLDDAVRVHPGYDLSGRRGQYRVTATPSWTAPAIGVGTRRAGGRLRRLSDVGELGLALELKRKLAASTNELHQADEHDRELADWHPPGTRGRPSPTNRRVQLPEQRVGSEVVEVVDIAVRETSLAWSADSGPLALVSNRARSGRTAERGCAGQVEVGDDRRVA
jgi:hypothetical protein